MPVKYDWKQWRGTGAPLTGKTICIYSIEYRNGTHVLGKSNQTRDVDLCIRELESMGFEYLYADEYGYWFMNSILEARIPTAVIRKINIPYYE